MSNPHFVSGERLTGEKPAVKDVRGDGWTRGAISWNFPEGRVVGNPLLEQQKGDTPTPPPDANAP